MKPSSDSGALAYRELRIRSFLCSFFRVQEVLEQILALERFDQLLADLDTVLSGLNEELLSVFEVESFCPKREPPVVNRFAVLEVEHRAEMKVERLKGGTACNEVEEANSRDIFAFNVNGSER